MDTLLAFLNSYLPYAFPAVILVLTPNRGFAVLRSLLLVAAIAAVITLKIFGADLAVDTSTASAAWHDKFIESLLLLVEALTVVTLVALFFKALTMATSGRAARYLQYGGFLGPLAVMWPAVFIPLSATLAALIALVTAVHLWRCRRRPRIARVETGYDPAQMLEKEPDAET